MKRIKDIYELFIVLIGLHYFYSFIILNGILNKNGIDYLPIISIEDITFSFGMINYTIIAFSLFGFVWIYGWHLLIDDEDKVINNTKDSLSGFHKCAVDFLGKKMFTRLSKERVDSIFYLLILLILFSIVYFVIAQRIMHRPDGPLGIMFLINFFIIPAYYIYYKSKRNIIITGYIVFTMIWGLFFIRTIFNNIESSKGNTISNISFEYHEKMISSNNNYSLVYPGYKYLIMRNNSTKACDLYPMCDVKKITYLKTKLK